MSRTESRTPSADERSRPSRPKARQRHRIAAPKPDVKRDASWEKLVGTLLSADQAQSHMKLHNPEQLAGLREERRVVALPTRSGEIRYPAFQFAPNGMPYKELAVILRTFHEVLPDEASLQYMVASWMNTAQPYLEQDTPLAWMKAERDSERLRAAAEMSAERLAH